MFEFWKTYKAQTIAIRSLQPFINYTVSQLPPNINMNWQKPHILGFMATIATLIAERVAGSDNSDTIAQIQSSTLASLIGTGREHIGERIYLLSSMKETAFQLGCKNGQHFFQKMNLDIHTTFDIWYNPIMLDPIDLAKAYYSNPAKQNLNQTLLDIWLENVDEQFYLSEF